MRLNDLAGVGSLLVVRDGEFLSLGLLPHRADGLLVSFCDRAYKDELTSNTGQTN